MIASLFNTKGILAVTSSVGSGLLAEAIGEGSPVTVGLMVLLLIGCWHLAGSIRGFRDDIAFLKRDQKTFNKIIEDLKDELRMIRKHLKLKAIVSDEETSTT